MYKVRVTGSNELYDIIRINRVVSVLANSKGEIVYKATHKIEIIPVLP